GSISVDAPISEATITTNSSRATTVTNPAGNLTVANTGTGTVAVTGINNSATLIATGSGATNMTSPDTDASFTVANNGTGLISVSGIANGKTITTAGTGQIAITTALGTGEKIIVDSANNNDIQITNTGAGLVDVQGDLALDNNDAITFTLTGNHTTVMSETGMLSLGNAPLSLNLASGYTPVLGDTITLIANDDANPLDLITGTFANKAEGSTIQVGNYYFKISYVGGTGNDIVLTMTGSVPVNNGGDGGDSITLPTILTLPPVIVTPPTPAPVFEKPVSKAVESQVPTAKNSTVKGDGNGDGISDVDQRNVISLPTQKDLRNTIDTPKVYLSIELPQGQILTKADVKPVSVVKNEQITFKTETTDSKGNAVVVDTPITKEMAPFGIFEFNFANVPSTTDARGNLKGGTTDVKLYLDDKQTVEKYLKQTVSGTWESIPFTYAYDEKLGKTVVSISLTDGDKFDLDGKIDGGIFDPGTPIITPKLTAAPIPVELPAPIEKVFMGYGSAFELTSGAAQIFGSKMREVLTLKSGASNVIVDQNVEQVNLAGKFADYTFEQQGNSLKVINNSTIVAKVFVQDDSNGTLLGFADGLRSASFSNATIAVTDKIVPADDIPLAILQKAGVYLAGVLANPITVGGNSVNVYGSLASTDTVGLSASATNATVDANVEQVNFAGKFADYSFVTVGNSLDVLSGTSKIANIGIQDDSNGTILSFSDQSSSAHFVTSATALQIELTGINPIL
ncbi:MAG: hypothetical protein PHQ03_08070, partial [Methylococcales bacterium]|nr:hypothetical protein [Methylococcales bacterium]